MSNQLHKAKFWDRATEELHVGEYKVSWLNKVTEDAKVDIMLKIKSSSKEQFQQLFQVPTVITDPKFVRRKKTFKVYSKNSQLELYNAQVKKQSNKNKQISEKADYEQVIRQTNNHKRETEFTQKMHNQTGGIFNNILWSDKYYNQIQKQSRLKDLASILDKNKLKGREELLLQFEQYFNERTQFRKQKIDITSLVNGIGNAFQSDQPNQVEQPIKTNDNKESQLSSFFTRPGTQGGISSSSCKRNIMTSLSSYRNQTTEGETAQSMRVSTSHCHRRKLSKAKDQLNQILSNTKSQHAENRKLVDDINQFINKQQTQAYQPKYDVLRKQIISSPQFKFKVDQNTVN